MRNNLKRHSVSLQSKGAACLLHIINDLGALSSGFLLHNPLHVQVSPGPFLSSSLGSGAQRMRANIDTLVLLFAVSLFSLLWESKVSCQHP